MSETVVWSKPRAWQWRRYAAMFDGIMAESRATLCAPADRRPTVRQIVSIRARRMFGMPISTIEGTTMNAMKLLGIALIVGGILGLVYGGFTYTKETHETRIGPLVLSVKDKETVNVPIWAGVGAIVIGGLLLVSGRSKA